MHFQVYNSADDFEPRTTPKPAPKFDCFSAPSVPEVSLILDKPVQPKKLENEKIPIPPEVKKQSYAEWREQNFSGKSFKPHSTYVNASNVQCDGSMNAHYTQQYRTSEKDKRDRLGNSNNQCYYTPKKKDVHQEQCEKNYNASFQSSNDFGRNRTDINSTSSMYGKSQPNTLTSNSFTYLQNTCVPPQTKNHLISQRTSAQRLCQNGPITINETVTNNTPSSPNVMTNHDGRVQSVASMNYPYPFYDMNSRAFPQHFYSPAYINHGIENQETVKNLLQLVNSQSEQIRALQTQVDRLLKMQEDTLRQNMKCVCNPHSRQQTEQYSQGTLNSKKQPNDYVDPQITRSSQASATQNLYSLDKNKDIFCEKQNDNQHESVSVEQQPKKTVVEQKVSIGVMTSFEFTVQNNPFILDTDEIENCDIDQQKAVLNRVNLCNTNDALRRGKNTFSRLPSGILENIVEDSESYLSSSQQQSSNLNASSSTRDLQDKQQQIDYQRDMHQRNTCNNSYEKAMANQFIEQKYPQYLDRWTKEKEYSSQNAAGVITDTERFMNNVPNHPVPNTAFKIANEQATKNRNQAHFDKKNVTESPYNTNNSNEKHSRNTKRSDCVDESLILSGGDLKLDDRPPTPEPSIHVEMQEYSSDDESDRVKRTSKVGWTFYNNVLGQVNQILQNTHDTESEHGDTNRNQNVECRSTEGKPVIDTVKVATLEQLRKLGISLTDNNEVREPSGKKVGFDTSYYPRLDYQANVPPSTSAISETNTSMHMKALALKYLNDEQLADLAIQKQGSASLKHVMLSNVQGTNMSFATMRYLERYQLLPGKGNAQHEGTGRLCAEMLPKLDANPAHVEQTPGTARYPFIQTPRTSCPSKILDISTLKQQPKLL